MLTRLLEPEVMDDPAEAAEYDAMDHREVNSRFVADLLHFCPGCHGPVLDLGAGTGLIPLLLEKALPGSRVVAVDAAQSMLRLACAHARSQMASPDFLRARAQSLPCADGAFSLVVSNSLIHHVPDPWSVLSEAWRALAPGGWIFMRDLARPDDLGELETLVALHATGESATARRLFADSLHAALTLDEVRASVARLGAPPATVWANSDRHWTWCCRKPWLQGVH